MTMQEIPIPVAEAIELKRKLTEESNVDYLKKKFIDEINYKYYTQADEITMQSISHYFEQMEQILSDRRKALEVWL